MASHGGAGQWHGAAHVPVHITQGDIKELGCPGVRDGTLGKRPQAQAFKTSGPFAGHGVRFLVRRRAPACALERVEEPVVQGLAEDAEVAATIRERLDAHAEQALEFEQLTDADGLAPSAHLVPQRLCGHDEGASEAVRGLFAVVHRKAWFLGKHGEPEALADMLRAECEAKPDRRRPIGFQP